MEERIDEEIREGKVTNDIDVDGSGSCKVLEELDSLISCETYFVDVLDVGRVQFFLADHVQ